MRSLLKLTALSFILLSCQKEITREDPNTNPGSGSGGGSSNSTKLVKLGMKMGPDSMTTSYTYNTTGKLIGTKTVGTNGGQSLDESLNIVRNSGNIITQLIRKGGSLTVYGTTELVTDLFYEPALSRYKYSLSKSSFFGVAVTDSTVFSYDGVGRLSVSNLYQNDGTGYTLIGKEEYTYTGNNFSTLKISSFDSQTNNWTVDRVHGYEYDSKVNPLQFSSDAVALSNQELGSYYRIFSANNATKVTMTVSGLPNPSITIFTYTYNGSNSPATAIATAGPLTMNYKFYYQ